MNDVAPDAWKQQYLDAVEHHESELRRWGEIESLLRRIIGRLCLAAKGQDARLDDELKRLSDNVRNEANAAALEDIIKGLFEAITHLDHRQTADTRTAATTGDAALTAPLLAIVDRLALPASASAEFNRYKTLLASGDIADPVGEFVRLFKRACAPTPSAAPPTAAPANDGGGLLARLLKRPAAGVAPNDAAAPPSARAPVAEILLQLIERIQIAPEMRDELERIKDELETPLDEAAVARILCRIADLVNEQRNRLQREKGEIERILQQVTGRLEEIDAYLLDEASDRQQAQVSGSELNTQVIGEMHRLSSHVQEAADLSQLKQQVRTRLDAINGHLQSFRQREETRVKTADERMEQMRKRVEELERETTTLRHGMEQERRQALIDVLTGIPNRLAYEERMDHEFKRWKRFRAPLSLMVWDIDHFKNVNDTFGHKAGDKVIRTIAQAIGARLRETDFVGRYGGEEFVMILAGTGAAEATRIADAIREEIARLGFHFRNQPVSITASCGITEFREGDEPDAVFDRADRALYKAKDLGRNRCVAA
ncbi:MAG: diguanylate cyclase [Ectothiorhodospiraceae bacterium]|jgi:diguanylate cyclase|nr:diguanylate cyclase [Ectothiorhodospiraceae bacterium]